MTIPKYQKRIAFLGGLECLIAAGMILAEGSSAKNTLLWGASGERWAAIIFAVLLGIVLIVFSFSRDNRGVSIRIQKLIFGNLDAFRFVSIVLFLFAVLGLLSPPGYWGNYSQYFEYLRPLLIVILTLPFQFFLPHIFRVSRRESEKPFPSAWIILFFLIMIISFMGYSRLGLKPDTHFWNVAGTPLTTFQVVLVLLITIVCFYLVEQISKIPGISPGAMNVGIALLIYIAGIWIWSQTPMTKHFFAPRPAPPAFEYYPYSDARIHDLGALSILEGYGINFGEYTDKPLYMIFLAGLHLFADGNYNTLSLLHLGCMGFILPAAFWFGKNLHGRHLGIALALVFVIRQRNAILLAHLLAGTNPRLLMTELPALLGILLICNLIHMWLGKVDRGYSPWKYALSAGVMLGAFSLVRLNPLGLLPVVALFVMLAMRKTDHKWPVRVAVFMLGFFMVFTPWLVTGRDAQGQPYLITKIIDIVTVRYPDTPSEEGNHQPNTRPKIKYVSHDVTGLNINFPVTHFPVFIINHAFHNLVTSFLALPDSPFPQDQDLRHLIKRPYFDEKQTTIWDGDLQPVQIPFMFINLILVSIGLGWSWRRWGWVGTFPAAVLIVYAITLGFARSSGSRYIVPVDWIVFFYYLSGIIYLVEQLSALWVIPVQNMELETGIDKSPNHVPVLIAVFVAMLVPVFQIPVITQSFPDCKSHMVDSAYGQLELVQGRALYPYLEDETLSFTFFACHQRNEINVPNPEGQISHGQTIVIGLSRLNGQPAAVFLEKESGLIPIWETKQ
jgi:hypothetical protein